MVERGENAASEKKREIGRAGTKHFPEYSPPRRFKPLKPGLLPPNSNCKTVNIHTINCFAQFLTIFYNARIQNRWKDNVYGKLDLSSGEDRGLISPTAAGNRALCICMERVLESGHCFWILGNVLSLRATVLSSSLFFPALCCCCCCCCCFRSLYFLSLKACLG